MTRERLERQTGVTDHGELVGLVDRARASDPDAWEALYRRAHPRLLSYARRRLGADAADEAVAETMARAVAGIDGFGWRGGGFDAWLYGILRHVVIDTQRARARGEARREPDRVDRPGPLEHVLQTEEAAAIRRAFATLDDGDQALLELRVVAGLSADEVGGLLSKRAGTVRMAQARALGRLRHALEDQS